MYVRAGRPAFGRPCVGVHRNTYIYMYIYIYINNKQIQIRVQFQMKPTTISFFKDLFLNLSEKEKEARGNEH